MSFTYNGKPILSTKVAVDELSHLGLHFEHVCRILEKGFPIRKRRKNIIEKGILNGTKIINVVVVDMGNYYKLIHVGKFTTKGKFKK